MRQTTIRLGPVSGNPLDQVWESDSRLRVGRVPNLEIHLPDNSVSRLHAEIVPTETGWVLRDLGSTNGSYRNGEQLRRAEAKLSPGDHLQFGDVLVRVIAIQESAGVNLDATLVSSRASRSTARAWEDLVPQVLDAGAAAGDSTSLLSRLTQIGRTFKPTDSLETYLNSVLWNIAEMLDAAEGTLVYCGAAHPDTRARVHLGSSDAGSARCAEVGPLLDAALTDDSSMLLQTETAGSVLCAMLRVNGAPVGAVGLVRTPEQRSFTERDLHLAEVLALAAAPSVLCFAELHERQTRQSLHILTVLEQLVQLRDDRIGGHCRRVTDYSLLLAEALGLSAVDKDHLRLGAPLHELGKLAINDAILNKPAQLSSAEMKHVRRQIERGAELLQQTPALLPLLPILRNTHERWDGSGYPDGLAGQDIPRLARVVAVADAFDAMTIEQPYRRRLSIGQALEELQLRSGTQFDPECVTALLQLRPKLDEIFAQRRTMTRTMSVHELREVLS